MIIFVILLIVSILLYIHYQPSIEKIKNGDWIMWYNNHENLETKRQYILIKKRQKYD